MKRKVLKQQISLGLVFPIERFVSKMAKSEIWNNVNKKRSIHVKFVISVCMQTLHKNSIIPYIALWGLVASITGRSQLKTDI